jgi:hypothetical protein
MRIVEFKTLAGRVVIVAEAFTKKEIDKNKLRRLREFIERYDPYIGDERHYMASSDGPGESE